MSRAIGTYLKTIVVRLMSSESLSVWTAASTVFLCHPQLVHRCRLWLPSQLHLAEAMHGLEHCTAIQVITIYDHSPGNSITADDCPALPLVVEKNAATLTEFAAHITLLPVDAYRILQGCSALAVLSLGSPNDVHNRAMPYNVTTHQLTSITNLLASLQRLTFLGLYGGWMSDTVLESLSSAIAPNPDLHTLDLSPSLLTPASFTTLSRLISSLPSVKLLDVEDGEFGEHTECQIAIKTFHHNTRCHQCFELLYSAMEDGRYTTKRNVFGHHS